jgi:insulysin
MTASEDRDSSDVDNSRRRQLLFSLLAASASPTMFSRSAFAEEEAASASTVTISKTVKDWSNIDIMKPPLDDRDYVTYIMDNGLRVLLCSDPTSTEAGAAMDVHVGACSDPEKVRGLAHFNEHMLFLGTKQYPQEDSFEAFLANNAGSSNAYTDSENTVYHFTMQAERDGKFQEGLSRFGSFFTSPLFTEGATERELNAIESENAKNLQSDNFRSYQIEKARQNPDHPHSKFFTGNKQTLAVDTRDAGLNLREQLIEFYGKYYSANQMTLAVVGPQSIDSLKAMVAEKFADIPNKGVPAPEEAWKGIIPIYNGASLIPSFGHVVKVVPVQDLRQVSLTWPIAYKDDQDRTNSLLTKQANYVGQLIAHEGPGSLLSHLKRQGWANSVGAATSAELSDYEAFLVTISLTVSGLSAINQVIEATFSYLKMLKEQVIPKYVFGEVLQIEELRWRFASKGSVSGYVQSLATSMQKYPPSLIVAGPRRLALAVDGSTLETTSSPRSYFSSIGQFDFTKDLTRDMIGQLTVDNALMTVMSKTFQGQTDKAEKWYGTEYSVERIPESTLNRWRDPAKPKKLGLDFPRKNVFIPSESGLNVKNTPPPIDRFRKRTFEERVEPIPPPRTVRDDGTEGRWTVYYKPDEKFGQPKAYIIFELLSKNVYSTAKNAALSNLYEYCVLDGLTEYAYDGKFLYPQWEGLICCDLLKRFLVIVAQLDWQV